MQKKNEWKEANPGKYCFIDRESFANIVCMFLPPLSTSVAQPADMGLYCNIQASFRRWFNVCDNKQEISRATKIKKVRY